MSIRNFKIHSGEQTATGNSGAIETTSKTIALAFDVTAFSGTSATLDITVEWSPDGTNFAAAPTPDKLAQIVATGVYMGTFDVKAPFYRVVYTVGGDVVEVQAITHDHTGGTFTLSFDGEGPTNDIPFDAPVASVAAEGLLTLDTKPTAAVAAQGTLTIDTNPIAETAAEGLLTIGAQVSPGVKAQGTLTIGEPVSAGTAAQGTLTIAEPVTDGDQFTIDDVEYTLLDTPAAAYDIAIGADEAATKVNIVAAINASGTPGTEYFAGTLIHPTVSAAAFSGDDCVLSAKEVGTAGNSIVTIESGQELTHASNVFDAGTLGTTTAGLEPDTLTIGTTVYRFMDTPEQAYDVEIGADEAATKVNIVAAINADGTPGTEYYAGTLAHPTVTAGDFSGDDCVVTYYDYGTAGNAIAFEETFAHASNLVDAATLGTTTAGVQPDTFTLGSQVYRIMETPEQPYDVQLGDDEAESKVNIIAAINASGSEGTEYYYRTYANPDLSAAAFVGDDAVITATETGLAGNALASTETFASASNFFDAATLGTETTATADTLTIGSTVYTFVDTLSGLAGQVLIGDDVEESQANLVAAINHDAGYGTLYSEETDIHPSVTIADFASNDAVVTANTAGTAGNSIATTETFDEATNVFDAATLGTTTAGVAADTMTVDTTEYTFVSALTGAANEVLIGATLATAQAALITAMADHATVEIGAFASDDAVLTAVTAGADGNAIATTETFAAGTNVFDAATLGTETLGVNGVETELELLANIDDVTVVRNGAGDWDVSFPSAEGDVAMITIDDTNLTGGTTSAVAESTKGVNATATFVGAATHFDN